MTIIDTESGVVLSDTSDIATSDTPTLGLRYLELKAAIVELYDAKNAVEDTIMQRMRQGGTTALLEGGVEINVKQDTPSYRVDELLPLKELLPEVYDEIVLPVPATVKVDGRKIRSWRGKSNAVETIAANAQKDGKQSLEVKVR